LHIIRIRPSYLSPFPFLLSIPLFTLFGEANSTNLAGGYLADEKGWRWIFWVVTICTGVFLVISYIFMHETNAAAILARKTRRLRKETKNTELSSKLDTGINAKDVFWRGIVRPTKLLFTSPTVFLTSIYAGTVYGYLFLLFTTFPLVFIGQYGFSSSALGLCYLGLGVGGLVGLGLFGYFSDRIMRNKAAPQPDGTPGEMKPEYRLSPILYGAVVLPIGLFIYGWTAEYKLHYMLPIFGTSLVGISYLPIIMCTVIYLIDAYPVYAASAVAANTVVRSAIACVLPLAGPAMYEALGLGWGNSVLGFIAVTAVPVSWLLIRYGEQIRKKYDVEKRL
jgi:MFS family permease